MEEEGEGIYCEGKVIDILTGRKDRFYVYSDKLRSPLSKGGGIGEERGAQTILQPVGKVLNSYKIKSKEKKKQKKRKREVREKKTIRPSWRWEEQERPSEGGGGGKEKKTRIGKEKKEGRGREEKKNVYIAYGGGKVDAPVTANDFKGQCPRPKRKKGRRENGMSCFKKGPKIFR